MDICPKCESAQIVGPEYDSHTDRLCFRCLRCGYVATKPPADRRAEINGIDLDLVFEQNGKELKIPTAQ